MNHMVNLMTTSTSKLDDLLFVDSETSNHMTSYEELFNDLGSITPRYGHIGQSILAFPILIAPILDFLVKKHRKIGH